MYYVSRILKLTQWTFFWLLLFTLVYFTIIVLIIYFVKSYILLDNWAVIALLGTGLSIIIYPSTFLILLSKEERSLLYKKLILERKKDA
jgi:hypothetical protein